MSEFLSFGGNTPPAFPGGILFCLLGRLEVVRNLISRGEEQRRVFCPPFTSRPNRRVWKQILDVGGGALEITYFLIFPFLQ